MNNKKIIDLLNKRTNTDINDYGTLDEIWSELATEFNGTEDEIVVFLESLTDTQIENASEVFEEIYNIIGESKSFIEKLKVIQKERPNVSFGL